MADFELCPYFEQAISIIGKKWTPLILRILMEGPRRFSELSRTIPQISAKMLADRMDWPSAGQIFGEDVARIGDIADLAASAGEFIQSEIGRVSAS